MGVRSFILEEDIHDFVDAFSTALDAKSACMCGHSARVAELSLLLARCMGLPLEEQQRIHIGAHLHDIGKIGIPDTILDKPGKLSEKEYAIIKQHPLIGSYIISKVKLFRPVEDIVRHHHERVDGRGYPDGLSGDEVSPAARIVAVADAVDAMMSTRFYRLSMGLEQVLAEVWRCRGTQFDERVVAVLIHAVQEETFQTLFVRHECCTARDANEKQYTYKKEASLCRLSL